MTSIRPSLQLLRARGTKQQVLYADVQFRSFPQDSTFYNSYNIQRAENSDGIIYRSEMVFVWRCKGSEKQEKYRWGQYVSVGKFWVRGDSPAEQHNSLTFAAIAVVCIVQKKVSLSQCLNTNVNTTHRLPKLGQIDRPPALCSRYVFHEVHKWAIHASLSKISAA
jgi:hypothetical protein